MPGLLFGQVGGTPQAGIVLLLASPGWAREGSPLTTTDLWTRPIEAANYLRLEDEREADDLLQLG